MPVQMSLASPVANEVFMHTSVNPAPGLVNTNAAQSFMCWLSAPTAVWTTTNQIASMVGAYTGTYNASTNPTTGLQIGTQQDGGSGVMVWSWGGVVLVSTSTGGNGVITPFTPSNNTWVHVAYTCTAISGTTQTHSLYVNGVLMARSTNALQVAGALTQIYINGYPQVPPVTSTQTSNTAVDDIRFYNRALSAAEISTIYNTMGAADGIVYGLVAYYTFDEGVVGQPFTMALDISAQNNTLVTQNNSSTPMTYIAGVTGNNLRRPQV